VHAIYKVYGVGNYMQYMYTKHNIIGKVICYINNMILRNVYH